MKAYFWLIIGILFCIFRKVKGYNVIPGFDFSGNNIGSSLASTDPETTCNNDQTCIGYSSLGSYGYCKNDFTNPTITSNTNFLVHGVEFGMQFIAVVNWNTPQFDMAGSPFTGPTYTQSYCAYLCTITASCVGTVWDIRSGSNECWLKTSFNNRKIQSGFNILIPVGNGGCPITYVNANTCINSIPYNRIPNFDLTGNDLHYKVTPDSAYNDCKSDSSCLGFNSNGYTKNGVGLPTLVSGTNFFVPVVIANTRFIVFQAFDNSGTNLQSTIGTTISGCAQLCSSTNGCVGAISDGSSSCWLKKNFVTPNQASNKIMLIPLKSGALCPSGTVASGSYVNLCINCPVGKIPSASGIGSCDSCPAGKSANPGSSTCTNCAAGQSSAAGGPCVACAAGQLSVSGGLCRNCLAGTSSSAGATACVNCIAGQSSTNGGLCSACPVGWNSVSGGLCYNCPYGISYVSGASKTQCVDSYTKIPQFNFNGITIGISSTIDTTYTDCQNDATCIGFNSDNYRKSDFNVPYAAQLYDSSINVVDYYIHAVGYGMQFIQVKGWNVINSNIITYTPYTSSACAYQCTIVTGCVAGVFVGSTSTCYLKSSFVQPSQDSSANMLLPAGKGHCPDSVITAGDCINAIPYNKIPGFDFDANVIGPKTTLNDAYTSCEADITCIGFNSNNNYKSDFGTPIRSASVSFYAHAVRFGMQFILVNGWNSAGTNFLTTPWVSTPSECAYKCTITASCVGAVMDGSNYCMLKAYFVTPNTDSNMKLLIPAGNGGCLFSTVNAVNCIQSIPYSKIPNFDFSGYNIAATGVSIALAYSNCNTLLSTCIGFNTNGFYKNNFSSPVITAGSDFYVHGLTYGMKFFRVKGWDSSGANIPYPSNILILSPSVCAWQCSVTPGCIGTVSDGGSGCWLKSSFSQPVKTAGRNMLIPVGSAVCPLGIGANCITPSALCSKYLPSGSLMSLLINAESTFKQLSLALANDPLNEDKFNDGSLFLNSFLNTEVDLNGDGKIVTQEVMAALKFRNVDAKGLSLNFNVWNCQQDFTDCASNSVDKTRIYNDALKCFLNSGKHLFDCSGVSIISNLRSEFPKSDDNAYCQKFDQTWYPNTYHKPYTNWTYTPAPTSTGQSSIGANGKVCIYSNGYNIDGAPFNSVDIGRGKVSGFQDPNRNVNVTSYRRVYCIAVLFNDGTYSYECSQGLFHVSITNRHNLSLL